MRRCAPLLAAALLFSVLLAAFVAPEADPAPTLTLAPAAETELSAFERDYALLWQELESSYPYLPYLEARGLDLDEIRTRYAGELPKLRDTADFLSLLQRMLAELGNFAHLNLLTPTIYRQYYSIYVLDETIAAMPEARPFRELLQDPGLAVLYRLPESAEEDDNTVSVSSVTVLYYPDCRALHLRISSFSQEAVERDRDIVAEALDRYPEAEHIIFDITGNGGGSDLYWMQDLVAPFGGAWPFTFRSFYRASPSFDRFHEQDAGAPVSELTDAPDWTAELGLTHYLSSSVTLPEEAQPSGRQVQTRAQRWLLVDGGVYSAADKFAAFCRYSGWATLVGTRTAGDGLGTTPVLFLLPETGLLLRYSLTAGENPEGTMNAAQGTSPDVLCIRGQLPLSRCLELIREAQGK